MIKITKRQKEILDFIEYNINVGGVPPTRVEIASHFGFKSANAAEEHLKALARKGFIKLVHGSSRGIRLPPAIDTSKAKQARSGGITSRGGYDAGYEAGFKAAMELK